MERILKSRTSSDILLARPEGKLWYSEAALSSGSVLIVCALSARLMAVNPSRLALAACRDTLIFSLPKASIFILQLCCSDAEMNA